MNSTMQDNQAFHLGKRIEGELHSSSHILKLAGKGLANPGIFSTTDIVALRGAVMRHIENRDPALSHREILGIWDDFA